MVLVVSWSGHGPSGTVQRRVTYVPWAGEAAGRVAASAAPDHDRRAAAALPDAEHALNYAFEPKADGWLN
jgi:hypothetical protein